MNLPNTITLGRIFLVPLLVVVLLTNPKELQLFGLGRELLGALIFGIASLTDWLDGYLARRRKQVTGFGQWMDPLADKLLVTAALISLVSMGRASAWMVAVILGREYAVTVLRSIAHARGHALPASPLGKVKLVTQVIAILLLILWGHTPGHWAYQLGQAALWVATAAALVSAVDYSRRFNTSLSGPPVIVAKDAAKAVLGTTPGPDRARNRVSA